MDGAGIALRFGDPSEGQATLLLNFHMRSAEWYTEINHCEHAA